MAYCVFDEGAAVFDSTPVDNMFITEYMLRAPGDYVKVYLYALMLCTHPSERMSNASMAKDLDMAEEDVERAFKYWGRVGLVRQIADHPPAYAVLNAKQIAFTRNDNPSEKLYARKNFMDAVSQALDGQNLSTKDCETVMDWVDILELPEDVVIMLLQMEKKRSSGRVSIAIADRRAREWAQSGIRTVEEVEKIIVLGEEREQNLRRLLARLGQRRQPSNDEKDMYRKWTDDWGFTPDAIQEACRETTKGTPTMAYLDGILLRQHQKGLHTEQEMSASMMAEKDERGFAREVLAGLGRTGITPTEEDLSMIADWQKQGADRALILLAAQTAHRKSGGGSMEETGDTLSRWRAGGLMTAEAVRKETERVHALNAELHQIYDAAGMEKRPGLADRRLLSDWKSRGMSMELILLAAEYARTNKAPIPAMGHILEDWFRAGIVTIDAARKEHEAHVAGSSRPQAAQPAVRDYQQRRYTEEDFRKMEVDLDADDPGNP